MNFSFLKSSYPWEISFNIPIALRSVHNFQGLEKQLCSFLSSKGQNYEDIFVVAIQASFLSTQYCSVGDSLLIILIFLFPRQTLKRNIIFFHVKPYFSQAYALRNLTSFSLVEPSLTVTTFAFLTSGLFSA